MAIGMDSKRVKNVSRDSNRRLQNDLRVLHVIHSILLIAPEEIGCAT